MVQALPVAGETSRTVFSVVWDEKFPDCRMARLLPSFYVDVARSQVSSGTGDEATMCPLTTLIIFLQGQVDLILKAQMRAKKYSS